MGQTLLKLPINGPPKDNSSLETGAATALWLGWLEASEACFLFFLELFILGLTLFWVLRESGCEELY